MRLPLAAWIVIVIVALLLLACIAAFLYVDSNLHTFKRQKARATRSGNQEKAIDIDGGRIAYLEGPNVGPALLLIHGQMVDKYNYAPALPALAKSFHVFAVDCYGHGASSHDPARYSNIVQGRDLLTFIKEVIRKPVLVSGHSSGGIVAALLASEGGNWIKGVLFEDPPFFTLNMPRAKTSWNWVDLATTAHAYIDSGDTDWILYSVEHSRMWSFFGESKGQFLDQAKSYHSRHPGEPIRWAWLPAIMNESFRSLPDYDPRFGDVFYRADWEEGWDLENALRSIAVPVIYQKSEAVLDAEGILQGATSDAEAARVRSLVKNLRFYTDKKGHSWHWQDPRDFVRRLKELAELAAIKTKP